MTLEANPVGLGAGSRGTDEAATKVVERQHLLRARDHTRFLPRGTGQISSTTQTVT